MRRRIVLFVATIQVILLAAHWFVYQTWARFQPAANSTASLTGVPRLAIAIGILSVTFVTASLLAWRSSAPPVRIYYTAAAIWLGFFNFFFLAACASWTVYGLSFALGLSWHRQETAYFLFGLAAAAGAYGLLNSMLVRVRHVPVKLKNLPAVWKGRTAALLTDTHLGHVRGIRFAKRIVAMVSSFRPDIILIGGDLYDGTAANVSKLADPLRGLSAPQGAYFIAGNHEEFGDHTKYLDAVKSAGVRVLNNEKVILDGLQLVGVHHRDAARPERLRAILQNARLDPNAASILLTHAPDQLGVAAEEGIGLQVSGHTHGGQFFPFTWLTSRVYRTFVYGLNRLGDLLVYTSSGAGTWGPPFRVGTQPEIVLFSFE
jgi:uncharacterized protein